MLYIWNPPAGYHNTHHWSLASSGAVFLTLHLYWWNWLPAKIECPEWGLLIIGPILRKMQAKHSNDATRIHVAFLNQKIDNSYQHCYVLSSSCCENSCFCCYGIVACLWQFWEICCVFANATQGNKFHESLNYQLLNHTRTFRIKYPTCVCHQNFKHYYFCWIHNFLNIRPILMKLVTGTDRTPWMRVIDCRTNTKKDAGCCKRYTR